MRIHFGILFFLTLFNFSGIPEILPELIGDDHAHCTLVDGDCSKEDQSEKEDSKEKEDGKESVLSSPTSMDMALTGLNLYARTCVLNEPGHLPEDHSPPPEFI